MTKHVQVIINPAAGHNDSILTTLNTVFRGAGASWDVSITHEMGDAGRHARTAREAGADVVAVYGGDGTVREVAGALYDSAIPMAILPGGTGNLTAAELGLPRNIMRAAKLIVEPHDLTKIDVGMANGEAFLVGAASGVVARVMEEADRDIKRRLGMTAYYLVAMRELGRMQRRNYRLTIDGEQVEMDGVAVTISNSGGLGITGMTFPREAELSDGLLNVVIFSRIDLPVVGITAADAVGLVNLTRELPHWTAREVVLEADPAESITVDGDIIGPTPIHISIKHRVLNVIVPKPPTTGPLRAQREARQRADGDR